MAPWTSIAMVNTSSYVGLMQYANSVTENMFGTLVCFTLFIIFFVGFRRYREDIAFATAGVIMAVLSILLRATGLVGDWLVVLFIFVGAAGSLLMYTRK